MKNTQVLCLVTNTIVMGFSVMIYYFVFISIFQNYTLINSADLIYIKYPVNVVCYDAFDEINK